MKRVGDVGPSGIVYLTYAVIGLGGWGEIKHGLKQLHSAPLHAYVWSHLSGFSAIQPLASSVEGWHFWLIVIIHVSLQNDVVRKINKSQSAYQLR